MAKVDYFIVRLFTGKFLANDSFADLETHDLFSARFFKYKHQALDESKKHKDSDVLLLSARVVNEWA